MDNRGTRRHGKTNEEVFWSFVNKTATCWLWTGGLTRKGYGSFQVRWEDGSYKTVGAHRFAYELLIGPIPDGKVLDHIVCDNPPCVNPWHTVPTTDEKNILRGTSPPAQHSRQTHCKNGHALTDDNIYHSACYQGERRCKVCARQRTVNYRNRKKENGHGSESRRGTM